MGAGDRERSESAMFHKSAELIRVLSQNCAIGKFEIKDNAIRDKQKKGKETQQLKCKSYVRCHSLSVK